MTFYYDEGSNELVGNNALDNKYGFARIEGDGVVFDVDVIMEEGRGLGKLKEIRDVAQDAIDANEGE